MINPLPIIFSVNQLMVDFFIFGKAQNAFIEESCEFISNAIGCFLLIMYQCFQNVFFKYIQFSVTKEQPINVRVSILLRFKSKFKTLYATLQLFAVMKIKFLLRPLEKRDN